MKGKMKKDIAWSLLVVTCLSFALSGCGGSSEGYKQEDMDTEEYAAESAEVEEYATAEVAADESYMNSVAGMPEDKREEFNTCGRGIG